MDHFDGNSDMELGSIFGISDDKNITVTTVPYLIIDWHTWVRLSEYES